MTPRNGRTARISDEIEAIVVACRSAGKSVLETCAWLDVVRPARGKRWWPRTVSRILARHRFELAPAVHGATRAARRRAA